MSEGSSPWHSRGYLPHFDEPGRVQMLTFRLADALPAAVLEEVERTRSPAADAARSRRLESLLGAGHGACSLRQPRIARLLQDVLHHFDGQRYRLLAWVIMPNHVHVLVETQPGYPLHSVVHTWKSYSANEANRLLQRTGQFWWPEYFDRAIRDEEHLAAAIQYIHANPVVAGLVPRPELWPWSSAAHGD